ncbi:MAG TPA: hypothetical protein DET40_18280 [Lentisphaeria bacterium]|nr:MAG: hypothetical protein A2X45_14420 [Lentisphaerae bacterium GWF2_50_93]HCE45492.1 hypothetical protein [Lentisphaeria bacterium]
MEWKFNQITPEMTKVDPSHLEFFRSEALADVVDALVREDIQNRLDAKRKGVVGPVKVRYYLSSDKDMLVHSKASVWLKGLDLHLNATKTLEELSKDAIPLNVPMSYLTIEDFNTTGLKGDPAVTKDPEGISTPENRNDFYWFIRNVGRTGKKAGDRGRWGLGKIVYPASSGIRSFFCYSIQEKTFIPALIGRSVLAIHSIKGCEYQSEGYFANYPDSEYKYLAMPEVDKDVISDFINCFNIKRTVNEPGLSLVVPFPEESITNGKLVYSVIVHYFWEILRGALEVEVSSKNEKVLISRETISDVASKISWLPENEVKSTLHRIEFCRELRNIKTEETAVCFNLLEPQSYGNPLVSQLFSSPEELKKASELFRSGKIIVLKVPVSIRKRKEGKAISTSFLVYLQKDIDLDRPDETFIRDGLTIIGESYIREPGIRALVLAEDSVLTEFLGDAENPAHTKWLSTTKHFHKKYSPGNSLLDYIKRSAFRLANVLGKVENEVLENLLNDIFGLPDPHDDNSITKELSNRRGKSKPPLGPGPGPSKTRYLKTEKMLSKTGFKISLLPEASKIPDRVSIRIAYELVAGNPFSAFHPADFDLTDDKGNVNVEMVGCEEILREPNKLLVNIREKAFTINITGFDPKRDLHTVVNHEFDDINAEDN